MKNLKNIALAGAIALASCKKEDTSPINTTTAKFSTFQAVFNAISVQTSPTGNGAEGQSVKVYPLSSITAKNGRDQTAPAVNLTLPTGWTRSINGDTATLNNAPAGGLSAEFAATVADFSTKNSTGGTNTFKGSNTKFNIQKTIDATPDAATKAFILDRLNNVTPNGNWFIDGIVNAIANYSSADNVIATPSANTGKMYPTVNGVDVDYNSMSKLYATLISLAEKYDPRCANGNMPAGCNTWEDYYLTPTGKYPNFNYDAPFWFKNGIVPRFAKCFQVVLTKMI